MKWKFRHFAAALAITAPVAVQAEDESARFELGAFGGVVQDDSEKTGGNDDGTFGGLASVAFGSDFLVQVDGMLAEHRSDTVAGVALHAGARVADGGFVGAYASVSENDRHRGLTVYRLGGQIDFDLGNFSLGSIAGYEDTDSGTFLIRTTATDDIFDVYRGRGRFFAASDIRFQPSKMFGISVGHRLNGGRNAVAAGVVVGLGENLALFAQGRAGKGDADALFIGLRTRFGGSEGGQPLLDNMLMEDLFTFSSTRRSLAVPLPPPDDDDDDDCGSYGGYCN